VPDVEINRMATNRIVTWEGGKQVIPRSHIAHQVVRRCDKFGRRRIRTVGYGIWAQRSLVADAQFLDRLRHHLRNLSGGSGTSVKHLPAT